MPCNTCNGFGYVRLIHRGHGVKDCQRPLIPAGSIRWYGHDYGVQTCYCPDCNPLGQTVAARKAARERIA
jgi:hypothetical protein